MAKKHDDAIEWLQKFCTFHCGESRGWHIRSLGETNERRPLLGATLEGNSATFNALKKELHLHFGEDVLLHAENKMWINIGFLSRDEAFQKLVTLTLEKALAHPLQELVRLAGCGAFEIKCGETLSGKPALILKGSDETIRTLARRLVEAFGSDRHLEMGTRREVFSSGSNLLKLDGAFFTQAKPYERLVIVIENWKKEADRRGPDDPGSSIAR